MIMTVNTVLRECAVLNLDKAETKSQTPAAAQGLPWPTVPGEVAVLVFY